MDKQLRPRLRGAFLGLLALLSASAFSQASAKEAEEEDPFDLGAFDQSLAAGLAPGGSAVASYLVGGSVLVRADSALSASFEGFALSSAASARLFAKASLPDFGAFYIAYNLEQGFLSARSGTELAALAPAYDLGQAAFALSELHWSFDIRKLLFLRLGNQLLAWGPSRIWTPVDFVNREKIDGLSGLDLRSGKPGLRLHLPLPRSNLFLFADFSRSVVAGAVQDPRESLSLAARLDASLGGLEFGLSSWTGARVADQFGFDFSGRILGLSLYGEAAWTPAYDEGEAGLAASLGYSASTRGIKPWTFAAELVYDSSGNDFSGDLAAMYARTPLYMGRFYSWLSLGAEELLGPELDTSLSALVNWSDLSYSLGLKETFSLSGIPPFSLSLGWKGGGAGKEFTRFSDGDYLSLSLEMRAEF